MESPVVDLARRLGETGYLCDDELATVSFADGSARACGGVLVAVVLHQRSPLAVQLGLPIAPPSPIAADAVEVGPTGETAVARVLVAGDAGVGMPSVANAVAAGSNAAAAVVRHLLTEDRSFAMHT